MKHSPAVITSVHQLAGGVGSGEGLQVGDGVEESGDSGRFSAEPRRPEDVEEGGVGHEICKRERAVEHEVEEGANKRTGGAWREVRV